ncbi:putative mucin/carbohydrate-binding domain-containing protein, partial [Paenibacillus larvae]
GTNVSIGQDTIPLKEGYTIKIYHAETRTRLKSPDFNLINSKSNDNMFIMTIKSKFVCKFPQLDCAT